MKIDRKRLNILLKSGLNPEVTTRKTLAERLSIGSTSVTRWFSDKDRLGNPRYPVVPDRHIGPLLEVFQLDGQALSLEDEAFRHYCFELAIERNKSNDQVLRNQQQRFKNIERLRLDVPAQKKPNPTKAFVYLTCSALLVFAILFFTFDDAPNSTSSDITQNNDEQEKCWTGYSSELGNFSQSDPADPCHYGKLFHNALHIMKRQNHLESPSASPYIRDYARFLSDHLDQRRIIEKRVLFTELGLSELHLHNYELALGYFQKAKDWHKQTISPRIEIEQMLNDYIDRATLANSPSTDLEESN